MAESRGLADTLLHEIRSLIGSGCDVAQIERALTDGYAYALALEGEQLRLERRRDEVLRDPGDRAGELAELTERVDGAAADVTHLRGLLADLRGRVSELRRASAA